MPTISVRATITAVAVIVLVVAFAAVRGQIGQPVVAAATPSAPTASAGASEAGDGSLTVQCSYLGVERINTFFSFRVISASET